MSNNESCFHGWPLREAVRRTVDRDLLLACIETRRGTIAAQQSTLVQDSADLEFRQHLRSGHLVAFGRKGSPTAELKPIPAAICSTLKFKDLKRSIALDETATSIFDVRIFSVLDAPDAVNHLDAVPIVEACRRFVFEDPQLTTLRKRAVAIGGQPQSFGYHWEPYGMVWPTNFGDISAWHFGPGYLRRFDEPEKFMRTRAADYILGERFARLIGYLRRGELIAEGVTKNGFTSDVPKSIWHRERTHLDLRNGDILELLARANDHTEALSRPLYLALTLRKASSASVLHVKPTAYGGLRQGTIANVPDYGQRSPRPRPVADDLAKVLLNTQLEDLAKARRWKEIASRIGDQMQKPPRSDADFLALAKAVRRHFRAKWPE